MTEEAEDNKNYRMPKGYLKGKERRRGKPLKYNEKIEKCNLNLTPTAKQVLSNLARQKGISMSEVIERWLRSEHSDSEKKYTSCQEELKQAQCTILQLTEKLLKFI